MPASPPKKPSLKRRFKTWRRSVDAFYALARRAINKRTEGKILGGPFAGMNYVRRSVGSCLEAKLLGTYELELHPLTEEICAKAFPWIINVGAAEGYYAVGLARRCPESQVIAYEAEEEGQELIRDLAQRNQCAERIETRGYCDLPGLQETLAEHPNSLVVMDVEGGELSLLDPLEVPQLADCAILVELHEFAKAGLSAEVRDRFVGSHTIREVAQRHRTLDDLPMRSAFLDRWLLRLINEHRPRRTFPMTWLYLEPIQTTA